MFQKKMIDTNEFANDVSPRSRKVIGLLCFIVSLAFGFFAILIEDSKYVVLALVIGLPLSLVSLSIFFGAAGKGKGIFSPFTFYLLGILIFIGGVAGIYNGEPHSWVAFLISLGCFAAARKRRESRKHVEI